MTTDNSQQRRYYKGNLHLHTTCSDGRRSPADSVAFYRALGYDFVAFTDHRTVTDVCGLSSSGFLAMHGIEIQTQTTDLGQNYHIVALGIDATPPFAQEREMPVQMMIDALNQGGALVFLAHPYWSGLTVNEMLPLQGLIGMEVYNTSADRDLGKALAAVHWDDVLVRGKRWLGLATDDTHWMENDAGEGFIMVEAEELSEPAILAALRAGRFYASTGPEIHDVRLDGDTLSVRCSPVSAINVIGHTQHGKQWRAEPGSALTEASYRLRGQERYVRAECIDARGRTAWSNPFYTS
jgi:hypothetical protein